MRNSVLAVMAVLLVSGCTAPGQGQQSNETGLWGIGETGDPLLDSCIRVSEFHYYPGLDADPMAENVTLSNLCSYAVIISNWTLQNKGNAYEAPALFVFPGFTLGPGHNITIHSGPGQNTDRDLFWGHPGSPFSPDVWANGGDTLFLYDSNGRLVLEEVY